MYLLNELILLSPLVIYSFFRIRKLFVRRAVRHAFTACFAFLVLGYPLAESLSHGSGTGWTRPPMIAGYYTLPLLLYLVLTVVVSDLIIGAMRLLRIVSKAALRSSRCVVVQLCIYLATPALIVVLGAVNNNSLQIKEYSVEVPRKSSSIRLLKIVFASDFHLGDVTSDHLVERFAVKVNALNPDLVLIGGDILEGHGRDAGLGEYERQFRQLRAKYGVYAVPGNHEMHGGSGKEFFDKSGIRLLQDSVVCIDGAFCLAGRNDGRAGNRKSIHDLLRDTRDDLPVILLDHRPSDLDNVCNANVDIQLSGHTHHGQLFPVNYITERQYELSWGYLKKGSTHFIVTSGVQVWGPPVRTSGRSEIVVINVALRDRSVSGTVTSVPGMLVHNAGRADLGVLHPRHWFPADLSLAFVTACRAPAGYWRLSGSLSSDQWSNR